MLMKMVFTKQQMDSKPLFRIGALILAIALVWPRFVPITGSLSSDAIDGIRGFLIGVSLALNIWALWRHNR
jgi:hypothetical protein